MLSLGVFLAAFEPALCRDRECGRELLVHKPSTLCPIIWASEKWKVLCTKGLNAAEGVVWLARLGQ